MRTRSVLGVLLCLASAGWSEVDLPEGIAFEPYELPSLDSMVLRTTVVRPYSPSSPDDVMMLELLQSRYGSDVVALADDGASIRIAASQGYILTRDSAGLDVGLSLRSDLFTGERMTTEARRTYGADGGWSGKPRSTSIPTGAPRPIRRILSGRIRDAPTIGTGRGAARGASTRTGDASRPRCATGLTTGPGVPCRSGT